MSLPADFVLPVDKPEGPTSHDIVAAVRRSLLRRRVGHTGTLDPFASGLLLVCVGKATRLAEYLSALDKTYEAVTRLGESTDTSDRDGRVVETREEWRELDRSRIENALSALLGPQEQVPPAFSAKKVRGEPAHRRARRGESVVMAPVSVTVHGLELTALELPNVGFRVTCSSGTYVRALARDLGDALGVGAHLVALRRTSIGRFGVEDAVPVSELEGQAAFERALIHPLEALGHLPTVVAERDAAARLTQGRAVRLADSSPPGLVAVSHEGALLAIGESVDGLLKPRKVFAT